jgi:nucleotide-binding universal stress UspA family protein
MISVRKILVYIDPEQPTQPALDRAVTFAGQCGLESELELVTVVEPMPWYSRLLGSSGELVDSLARDAREKLERLADPLIARGERVTTQVLQGKRSLEITRAVLAGGHDLVVKSAEADCPGALGTSDLRLIRSCPGLVLILHRTAPERFERILAAVNPRGETEDYDPFHLELRLEDPAVHDPARENALNNQILALAAWIGRLDQAEVHLAHAWHVPGEDLLRGDPRVSRTEVEQYVQALDDEDRALFESVRDRYVERHGPVQAHRLKGRAGDVIARVVQDQRIDLLVMGTVCRTGITGYVIGNTAESVLGRVACSVLAVKPEGFVSPVSRELGGSAASSGPAE